MRLFIVLLLASQLAIGMASSNQETRWELEALMQFCKTQENFAQYPDILAYLQNQQGELQGRLNELSKAEKNPALDIPHPKKDILQQYQERMPLLEERMPLLAQNQPNYSTYAQSQETHGCLAFFSRLKAKLLNKQR